MIAELTTKKEMTNALKRIKALETELKAQLEAGKQPIKQETKRIETEIARKNKVIGKEIYKGFKQHGKLVLLKKANGYYAVMNWNSNGSKLVRNRMFRASKRGKVTKA